MKRISFLLASLTAILLLSCGSFDNSNSPAEDVSYPQAQALQKVSPVDNDITPYATSLVTAFFGPMSVSAPTGSTASSSTATATIPTVPAGTAIINTEICPGSLNGTGTFILQSITVTCGSRLATVSTSGSCVNTSVFNGFPVPTTCSAYFTGKCVSGPCVKTLTNTRITF